MGIVHADGDFCGVDVGTEDQEDMTSTEVLGTSGEKSHYTGTSGVEYLSSPTNAAR